MATLLERSRDRRRLPEPRFRRLLREGARLSLRDVAEALGVERSTVSRWETGRRLAPRDPAMLARYVELLDRLAAER
ncbi:MAG: helix-turn-helix domain-containing protein [Chloroflexota bacterium]|nr:helix-turn-helix domain-containing protein [Chloroflexota bacterium]